MKDSSSSVRPGKKSRHSEGLPSCKDLHSPSDSQHIPVEQVHMDRDLEQESPCVSKHHQGIIVYQIRCPADILARPAMNNLLVSHRLIKVLNAQRSDITRCIAASTASSCRSIYRQISTPKSPIPTYCCRDL